MSYIRFQLPTRPDLGNITDFVGKMINKVICKFDKKSKMWDVKIYCIPAPPPLKVVQFPSPEIVQMPPIELVLTNPEREEPSDN